MRKVYIVFSKREMSDVPKGMDAVEKKSASTAKKAAMFTETSMLLFMLMRQREEIKRIREKYATGE